MASDSDTAPYWVRLLKITVFVSLWVFMGWIAVSAVPSMLQSLRNSRCKSNLKQIAAALGQYLHDNDNQFPPWLTALYPRYLKTKDVFICPFDRLDKSIGAQPEWMKQQDTGHEDDLYREYKTVDLDGPTGDPDKDRDTIPCSYMYALSFYTEPGAELSWRDAFYEQQTGAGGRKRREIPIVRCYHHLKAKERPEFDELGDRIKKTYDASYETPTNNILFDLSFHVLPYDWWNH